MDLIPKFLLSKYDTVELIGQGAHGKVFKCTITASITAVKVLNALDPSFQARFENEVSLLQRVNHKHVVKLLNAGEDDGYYWYESEYADKGDLGDIHAYLFVTDADRASYLIQACFGVMSLHNQDPPIIHRDLKPSNILVFNSSDPPPGSVLKIADFGLATIVSGAAGITATGEALGTAYYIAPERERYPRIKTPRSDIYSLGITFLKAYTGHTRPSQENLDRVPTIFRPVIERMVKENPNDRYQSISEVLQDLRSVCHKLLLNGGIVNEGEIGYGIYSVPIGRELENALELLNKSNSSNILQSLSKLEYILDRLGDVHDHQAAVIMNIDRNALSLVEKADKEKLLHIIQRFDDSASRTSDHDSYRPSPLSWASFLANAFDVSSYRPTKSLCLESLANFLVRFKTPEVNHCVYRTIESIKDPSYMGDLADNLRRVGREDIADLLVGAPDEHPVDLEALRRALNNAKSVFSERGTE